MIRIKMMIKITQTNKANKIMNNMRWNKKQAKSNKNKRKIKIENSSQAQAT